ncbi:MAG: CDP-alcohol phosphatidyltransferase family protein [Thermodesulfobacteriota bacterium]
MSSFNIPNALSIFRILLVPVFFSLTMRGDYLAAALVFTMAGITDAVDGFIARRFNMRTPLGAALDPAADKLLQVTAYVTLTFRGVIPLWLCVPVLAKDAILVVIFLALRSMGRRVEISPSIPGKLSTVLQITTVAYVLFFGRADGPRLVIFMALALATAGATIMAGLHYAWREYKGQAALPDRPGRGG